MGIATCLPLKEIDSRRIGRLKLSFFAMDPPEPCGLCYTMSADHPPLVTCYGWSLSELAWFEQQIDWDEPRGYTVILFDPASEWAFARIDSQTALPLRAFWSVVGRILDRYQLYLDACHERNRQDSPPAKFFIVCPVHLRLSSLQQLLSRWLTRF